MIEELLIKERRAKMMIDEAKKKAEEIIQKSQEQAEKIRRNLLFQDKTEEMNKAEKEAEKEAEKIICQYDNKIKEIKRKAEDHIKMAVTLVLKEMLST